MNEIVFTYTLGCDLAIDGTAVARALTEEHHDGLELPRRNPISRYAVDGGPSGPIPAVVRLRRFSWEGGQASVSVKALRAFAGITRGRASFVLFDAKGDVRGWVIDAGQLFEATPTIEVKRKRGRK